MRVRIISYEDVNAWILGKFARRLNEELIKLGVDSDIDKVIDPSADINHHIIYTYCDPEQLIHNDSLMITHVDESHKAKLLEQQIRVARVGICMSRATMDELTAYGILSDKLCYINPAHDNIIKPARYVIGITSKVQSYTGSKREDIVMRLANSLDPDLFELIIMGAGWEHIIKKIKNIEVTYYQDFNYEKYVELMPTFDYYLYTGQDEGSMGFVDALAAGVKTIVTPQGFHLDALEGISHSFNTGEELIDIFNKITEERRKLIKSVANWTWADYAKKHLEVWEYLKSGKINSSQYSDGLNSLLKKDLVQINVEMYKSNLQNGSRRRIFYLLTARARKLGDFKFIMKKLRSWVG